MLLPGDGVEEELKGAFGLRAVLHAEAEEDDPSFAASERDGGGFALETLGAFGVARDEDVFGIFGIPGDDGTLDIGRRRGRLEGNGRINEGSDFRRHAVADGMVGVEVDAEERAWDVEVAVHGGAAALRRGQGVPNGKIEFLADNDVG